MAVQMTFLYLYEIKRPLLLSSALYNRLSNGIKTYDSSAHFKAKTTGLFLYTYSFFIHTEKILIHKCDIKLFCKIVKTYNRSAIKGKSFKFGGGKAFHSHLVILPIFTSTLSLAKGSTK